MKKIVFTKEQLRQLADLLAAGETLGCIAGALGVSSPTLANQVGRPDFLDEVAAAFDKLPDASLLKTLEYWYQRDGERLVTTKLRLRLGHALRMRFRDADRREQARARRRGHLERHGQSWTWNAKEARWEGWGGEPWWNDEHESRGTW